MDVKINMNIWLKIILELLVLSSIMRDFYIIYPLWGMPFNKRRHGLLPHAPAWELECWLWENNDNTADYVDEFPVFIKEGPSFQWT